MTWEDIIKQNLEREIQELNRAIELCNDAIISLARTGEHGEIRMKLIDLYNELERELENAKQKMQ